MHKQYKKFLSWNDVEVLCRLLKQQISNEHFDKIVGITRGGAVPGVILSHMLGVKLYTIGLKTYDGENQTDKIEIYGLDPIFYINCKNSRILIVDDICDSGNSISILKDLVSRCTTIAPKFATLHLKAASSVTPDYYAQLTNDYIVYPWENVK